MPLFSITFLIIKCPLHFKKHGEFCTGAVELQDWLADKFERRLENEGSRDDGQKAGVRMMFSRLLEERLRSAT